MQAVPARPVVEWLDRQPVDANWLTSVTVFEAGFGTGLLTRGRRPLRGARLATRNLRDFGDLGVGGRQSVGRALIRHFCADWRESRDRAAWSMSDSLVTCGNLIGR